MKVSITARKFKARDTLKEFIKDELNSLSRFYEDIIDAEVILSYQNSVNSVKIVEVVLGVPGRIVTVTEQAEEYEIATRSAVEKLKRQLQKIKDKRQSRA